MLKQAQMFLKKLHINLKNWKQKLGLLTIYVKQFSIMFLTFL